jgi:hypothetical protein
MQRQTTPPPSPPPADTPERELRKMAEMSLRTGMALVRHAKETLRRLDEADRMKTDTRKGK